MISSANSRALALVASDCAAGADGFARTSAFFFGVGAVDVPSLVLDGAGFVFFPPSAFITFSATSVPKSGRWRLIRSRAQYSPPPVIANNTAYAKICFQSACPDTTLALWKASKMQAPQTNRIGV